MDNTSRILSGVSGLLNSRNFNRGPAWVLGEPHSRLLGQSGLARPVARAWSFMVSISAKGQRARHETSAMAAFHRLFWKHWDAGNVLS